MRSSVQKGCSTWKRGCGLDRDIPCTGCSYTGDVSAVELPLFPLHSVLFPGGELRLRIFEPRYLDMLRECGRRGTGFGVCLIVQGREAGAPAIPAAWGTRARIADFYTLPDGLLGISAEGEERFRVERTRVRDNGLVVGSVRSVPEPQSTPVAPEHGLLVTLLERLLEQAGGRHERADRACFDDSAWVAWRLAELLPIDNHIRQELLQLHDPHARLERVLEAVAELQAE